MYRHVAFGLGLAVASLPMSAGAAAIDVSTWVVDGAGNWDRGTDTNSVTQSRNSRPTVFHDNRASSQGRALAGKIRVGRGDNDFVGFVLGYRQGDVLGDNADTDYLLIDWKQGTQGGWGEGMAISRVTGPIDTSGVDTSSDAWDHVGNVDLITRSNAPGARFANTGWEDGEEYAFELVFTEKRVAVTVDGETEIDISPADAGILSFADGAFGFYNFSQPNVLYSGLSEDTLPEEVVVPVPGALPLFASALGAAGLLRYRRGRGRS